MRSMIVRNHRVAGGSPVGPAVKSVKIVSPTLEIGAGIRGKEELVILLIPSSDRDRCCKLSLTVTAKKSTIRGRGRLYVQTLSWSSGGRRANCGKLSEFTRTSQTAPASAPSTITALNFFWQVKNSGKDLKAELRQNGEEDVSFHEGLGEGVGSLAGVPHLFS